MCAYVTRLYLVIFRFSRGKLKGKWGWKMAAGGYAGPTLAVGGHAASRLLAGIGASKLEPLGAQRERLIGGECGVSCALADTPKRTLSVRFDPGKCDFCGGAGCQNG